MNIKALEDQSIALELPVVGDLCDCDRPKPNWAANKAIRHVARPISGATVHSVLLKNLKNGQRIKEN